MELSPTRADVAARVGPQMREAPTTVLATCAPILEASAARGGVSDSDASAATAPSRPSEHLLPVVGSPLALDEISDDLARAIRRWLARGTAADAVKETHLWYAQRGLAEPPAQTVETLVASIQEKREAKRAAALKAWAGKTDAERKAWVSELGRGPRAGAKRANGKNQGEAGKS